MEKANLFDRIKAMDTPEGHQRFIKSQWRDFAAYAWRRYLSEGRGAVIIDLPRAKQAGTGFQIPTFYVADQSEKLMKRGGWPDEEITELVHEYDPAEEVVFMVLRLKGKADYYNASDDPPPPEAFDAKSTGDQT